MYTEKSQIESLWIKLIKKQLNMTVTLESKPRKDRFLNCPEEKTQFLFI